MGTIALLFVNYCVAFCELLRLFPWPLLLWPQYPALELGRGKHTLRGLDYQRRRNDKILINFAFWRGPDPPTLSFFFFSKGNPKKNKGFSLRGTHKILGKERKNTPKKQGKSENKKSKEIEKSKDWRVRGVGEGENLRKIVPKRCFFFFPGKFHDNKLWRFCKFYCQKLCCHLGGS